MHTWLEGGLSRLVLIKSFMGGDEEKAESIGIHFGAKEKVAATAALAVVTVKAAFYRVGLRVPVVSRYVDNRLNTRLVQLLDMYGHANFVTDAERYKVSASG
jgi:hypothetical protein